MSDVTNELPNKRAKKEQPKKEFVQKAYKPPPPTPLDATTIPMMTKIIEESNASTHRKIRQTMYGLYNHCLQQLSRPLPTNSSKPVPGSEYGAPATLPDRFDLACSVVEEMISKHKLMPKTDTIAMLLNACDRAHISAPESSCGAIGVKLFWLVKNVNDDDLVVGQGNQSGESVVTCALRLLFRTAGGDESQLEEQTFRMLRGIPRTNLKRRLFVPLLKHCEEGGKVQLAQNVLDFVAELNTEASLECEKDATTLKESQIEFWDADFLLLIGAAQTYVSKPENCVGDAVAPAKALLARVFEEMLSYHPMVGNSVSNVLLKTVTALEGCTATVAKVDAQGEKEGICSDCGERLEAFRFTVEECDILLKDIIDKLVEPRTKALGHHLTPVQAIELANNGTVLPLEETKARWESFRRFQLAVEQGSASDATVVIDGANVGYYGLNSWYPDVKREILIKRGVNPADIKKSDLMIHLPVDVPVKVAYIQSAVEAVVAKGMKPVVILHERHLLPENIHDETSAAIINSWKEQNYVLASPAFLNDDYCWMYASIARSKKMILDGGNANERCHVVSNDLMRDHHFCLLSQRKFLRWRQANRVTYKVGWDHHTKRSTMWVRFPQNFSMWVQRTALAGSSAAGASLATQRWHVPVVATAEVIDQSTNQPEAEKNKQFGSIATAGGEDKCDHWLCMTF